MLWLVIVSVFAEETYCETGMIEAVKCHYYTANGNIIS